MHSPAVLPRPLALGARVLGALVLGGLLPGLAAPATADRVEPSERVSSRVVVREGPDRAASDVGSLRPGDAAALLDAAPGAAPGWHRVRLADGTEGYVSAAWTRVEPEEPAFSEEPEEPLEAARPSFWERARRALLRAPRVELALRDPRPGVYRHEDPNLPVSGIARLAGGADTYDVMLALDVSTSTNEHSGTDVDGDGRSDDSWMGPDSIYAAQLAAARRLVHTLSRLPGNRNGARIQLGIVSYAGAERFHRDPSDAELPESRATLDALARRDAELCLPLTSDYAAADRVLRQLERVTPVGMTNAAAGIGRALIELEGLVSQGARSEPRRDARRLILFLTDGQPRLPYDRERADRWASLAGKWAAEVDVQVNAFALGKNAVTRSPNGSVERMARRTGGRYVAVRSAGDVVSVLDRTPFSRVERVRISNRTTGRETGAIATGIDGSFYGEVPLVEGANQIEVAAELADGGRHATRFDVEYVRGRPARELAEQLKEIKVENESLIEEIKDRLAARMRRERQQRSLELTVEEEPLPADLP